MDYPRDEIGRTGTTREGLLRGVAATTAAPRTGRPPLVGSRRFADRGPRGDDVVDDDAPAAPEVRRADAVNAPARLAARAAAPRPAWSTSRRLGRSAATTAAEIPARRSEPAATRVIRSSGSWPRSRTTPRRDGTGTSDTVAGSASSEASSPRTASASASPSGRVNARRASSLCATRALRTTPSYAETVQTGGSPGGHGSGLVRHGRPQRAGAHCEHQASPGRSHPTQDSPSTRSAPAARIASRSMRRRCLDVDRYGLRRVQPGDSRPDAVGLWTSLSRGRTVRGSPPSRRTGSSPQWP